MKSRIHTSDDAVIHPGSGNVFADLGLPEPEEDLVKATLAMRITRIVAERDWNQSEAARAMKIDQPKVSALMHGRLASFSAERLLSFLIALDQDVEIVVKPKADARQQATVRVSIQDSSAVKAAQ